ncbi:unnamed protein product, partial [marine sediment metagenome]
DKMTLEEAIRVNTVLKGAPVLKDDPLVIEALQLGIEALTLYDRCRSTQPVWLPLLLPSETKY